MSMMEGLKWDDAGLIPVVAQDRHSGQVRMVAYANRTALELTLERRTAHFYSRSRKEIWQKGETSGNIMDVIEVWMDCDRDALIYVVDAHGPTCHTGEESCFFFRLDDPTAEDKEIVPTVERLWRTLASRKDADAAKSYTKMLLERGKEKIADKIREEGGELALAVREEAKKRVASEAADLVYHMMVGLLARDVTWQEVLDVLAQRFGISGIDEKASRFSVKP